MHQINYVLQKIDDKDIKKKISWTLLFDGAAKGSMWIDLQDSEYTTVPCLCLQLSNNDEVNQDSAKACIKGAIKYAYCNLPYTALYSRYQTRHQVMAETHRLLEFEKDGDSYLDNGNLEWQNTKLVL